jgi:uncharacterized protein (DUF2141 family)
MTLLEITFATTLMASAAATPGVSQVEITIDGVKNERGDLHLCLTRETRHFPNCGKDPAAIKRTLPATARQVTLDLTAGEYALSVFHDADGDRDLDTFLGIPREGFGFSRNPRVRFGAPRFKDVLVGIPQGFSRLSVRMQYML